MTKQEFISKVMAVLDEARVSGGGADTFYIGADGAQIDRHIENSYIDAWHRCANSMPAMWFENEQIPISTTTHKPELTQGTGYIQLPDRFYKLTKLKMKGWVKPVYRAYHETERVANIQTNEYTRGSTIRPVCVLEKKIINNKTEEVLRYYSLPKHYSTHEVEEALYLPMPEELKELGDEANLPIDDRVIEPMAYLCASTVLTLLEKPEAAKAIDAKVMEMYPGIRNQKGTNIS